MQKKGYLVLIGGAEDRSREKIILKETVRLNNARKVVVIPTASSYPSDLGNNYYYAFRDLGVDIIEVVDVRTRSDADRNEYLKKLTDTDMVFFTGGDQVKLVDILSDTKLHRKISRLYKSGVTIAGTSAGAAAASDPLIYSGDDKGLFKGEVRHDKGFGFLKNITVDTHFSARIRLQRLTQFLLSGYNLRGIGIDEDTAIIVNSDNEFEVIGSGAVTVVNTRWVSFSDYNEVRNNNPFSVNGVHVGFLQPGTIFNTQYWKIIETRIKRNSPLPENSYSGIYYNS